MKLLMRLAMGCLFLAVVGAQDFKAGDPLEISWGGKWYPGVVLEVKDGRYKVRYDGYSTAWDEWTGPDKVRRKEPTPPAAPPAATVTKAVVWQVGDRVEALSVGSWYKGTVVATDGAKVRVHYDGYNSSADEWREPAQVRPLAGPAGAGKVAVVRPAGAQAGIEGAFLRVESYYFGSTLSLNNEGWFFTKDGRFSKAPQGGFDFATFAKKANLGQTEGTYWIADGKITFAWANGSTPTAYEFRREKDDLVWGGLGSTRVEGFKPGWRFDGVYEGGASVGGGALMSSTTLTFARDGTFRRGSVSSFKAEGDRSTVSGGATDAADGTYEFNGHTLTLVTKGGVTQAFTVFAFSDKDAAGRPAYLYRDGSMMRRQDRL